MTYCMAGKTSKGITILSDTRTNSGVDNISTFKKSRYFKTINDELDFAITYAGNLATCQELDTRLAQIAEGKLYEPEVVLDSSFQIAITCGRELKSIIKEIQGDDQKNTNRFTASAILATRHAGNAELYLVYPEGNFIKASDDTPFFQIGETKYGRPLIINHFSHEMELMDLLQLFRDSLDMTIPANLSVGYPADYILLDIDMNDVIEGRFDNKQDIDIFSKYVELKFATPEEKHTAEHFKFLTKLSEDVREQILQFRENVRNSNSLSDEKKAFLSKAADSLDRVVDEIEEKGYLIDCNQVEKESWLRRYSSGLRMQFEIITRPETLGEKTVPLGLLVSFSALGFAVAGGVGAALGALTARAISSQSDISKDIHKLIEDNEKPN